MSALIRDKAATPTMAERRPAARPLSDEARAADVFRMRVAQRLRMPLDDRAEMSASGPAIAPRNHNAVADVMTRAAALDPRLVAQVEHVATAISAAAAKGEPVVMIDFGPGHLVQHAVVSCTANGVVDIRLISVRALPRIAEAELRAALTRRAVHVGQLVREHGEPGPNDRGAF